MGADDFISKPINFDELVARIRALFRRRALDRGEGHLVDNLISIDDLVLNRTARQVWRAGQPLRLCRRELDLLGVLVEWAGHPLSRESLFCLQSGEYDP